jgi:hypothetical protein
LPCSMVLAMLDGTCYVRRRLLSCPSVRYRGGSSKKWDVTTYFSSAVSSRWAHWCPSFSRTQSFSALRFLLSSQDETPTRCSAARQATYAYTPLQVFFCTEQHRRDRIQPSHSECHGAFSQRLCNASRKAFDPFGPFCEPICVQWRYRCSA